MATTILSPRTQVTVGTPAKSQYKLSDANRSFIRSQSEGGKTGVFGTSDISAFEI